MEAWPTRYGPGSASPGKGRRGRGSPAWYVGLGKGGRCSSGTSDASRPGGSGRRSSSGTLAKGDAEAISLNATDYSITQSKYLGKVTKTFSVANAIPALFKSWIWAQIAASVIAIMIYYLNRRQNHEVKHTNP